MGACNLWRFLSVSSEVCTCEVYGQCNHIYFILKGTSVYLLCSKTYLGHTLFKRFNRFVKLIFISNMKEKEQKIRIIYDWPCRQNHFSLSARLHSSQQFWFYLFCARYENTRSVFNVSLVFATPFIYLYTSKLSSLYVVWLSVINEIILSTFLTYFLLF